MIMGTDTCMLHYSDTKEVFIREMYLLIAIRQFGQCNRAYKKPELPQEAVHRKSSNEKNKI
jgi:hypothetical protein